MRNGKQWTALLAHVNNGENTSTDMYSTRSRVSTAPATLDTEDSLRRENIEHDEQSLNGYVKVCLEKLL